MEDFENLYAEFTYDLEELTSFVNVLKIAAEQETYELTHQDIEHNIEIIYEKFTKLMDKNRVLRDMLIKMQDEK